MKIDLKIVVLALVAGLVLAGCGSSHEPIQAGRKPATPASSTPGSVPTIGIDKKTGIVDVCDNIDAKTWTGEAVDRLGREAVSSAVCEVIRLGTTQGVTSLGENSAQNLLPVATTPLNDWLTATGQKTLKRYTAKASAARRAGKPDTAVEAGITALSAYAFEDTYAFLDGQPYLNGVEWSAPTYSLGAPVDSVDSIYVRMTFTYTLRMADKTGTVYDIPFIKDVGYLLIPGATADHPWLVDSWGGPDDTIRYGDPKPIKDKS